ncbi:hypothetical protein BDY21DRAFT_173738 [Lineolata rhizophorae]|uniref:Uncharacterized protein n=1 Tax=Lineolata rhizophorae TaxID=578093 RepID=A0A6A6NL22_9PEZI|nr:hypothetical protein BDY21DRAFT_173738 [Lineolata rhizophorae]
MPHHLIIISAVQFSKVKMRAMWKLPALSFSGYFYSMPLLTHTSQRALETFTKSNIYSSSALRARSDIVSRTGAPCNVRRVRRLHRPKMPCTTRLAAFHLQLPAIPTYSVRADKELAASFGRTCTTYPAEPEPYVPYIRKVEPAACLPVSPDKFRLFAAIRPQMLQLPGETRRASGGRNVPSSLGAPKPYPACAARARGAMRDALRWRRVTGAFA